MLVLLLMACIDVRESPGWIDRLERNQRYDEHTGQLQFTQWIAWHDYGHRYHVRAWCIDKGQVRLTPNGDEWVMTVWIGDELKTYRVRVYFQSVTTTDPERDDLEWLPKEDRIGW